MQLYSRKQRLKDQVFFDTWKPLLQDIRNIQETTTKAYTRLWDILDDLLEEFGMKLMPPINEVTPTKLRIVEVEEHRELSQTSIDQMT